MNEKTKTDENINSLNFSKIYVIITQGTAATSEMFINNLMPYISVYTFGNTTQGHGLGSLYIKDYDPLNPLKTKHKWAMQLITTKSLNVNGNSFFNIGISPSKDINENYIQLLPLGDTKETLLNAAISKITSDKSALLSNSSFFEFYADKNDLIPHRKEIILNNFAH